MSLARSLGLYDLALPLSLHYNHFVSLSVNPWSVTENAHPGSCTLLSVDFYIEISTSNGVCVILNRTR